MVLIFLGTWKHAIRGTLAVAFSAAVIGGSLFVIMEEKEARKKNSQQKGSPAAPESNLGASDPTPGDGEKTTGPGEQTTGVPEPTPGPSEQTPVTVEKPPADEEDAREAARRSESPDQFVSESVTQTAPRGLEIVHVLPRSQEEFAAAFERARRCAVVPPDQPLERTSWADDAFDDPAQSSAAMPQSRGLRRSVLAIGLSLSAEEQSRLPEAKRERILENLHGHYISIQVSIQRGVEKGGPYLHHLPLAATAKFEGPPVTGRAGAAIVASAGEFRSLGVWVADGGQPTSENLRTLVLIHRQMVPEPESKSENYAELRPSYELVFIHALPDGPTKTEPTALAEGLDADAREPGEALTLHAFITSGERSRLHHLPSGIPPQRSACGIHANLRLNNLRQSTADPDQSIVREVSITDRADYPVEDLDRYVSTQGWSGDAWDNIPEILSAAVDAKLELAVAPATIADDASITFTKASTNAASN